MSKLSFNALIPELTVSNIHRTKKFYIDVLGFILEYERKEEGFIFLSFHQAQMMFEQYHDDGWNAGRLEIPMEEGSILRLLQMTYRLFIKSYRSRNQTLLRVKGHSLSCKRS